MVSLILIFLPHTADSCRLQKHLQNGHINSFVAKIVKVSDCISYSTAHKPFRSENVNVAGFLLSPTTTFTQLIITYRVHILKLDHSTVP